MSFEFKSIFGGTDIMNYIGKYRGMLDGLKKAVKHEERKVNRERLKEERARFENLNQKKFNTLMQEKLREKAAQHADKLWKKMSKPKPNRYAFILGCIGYESMKRTNGYLGISDWSMGAGEKRFYLINMKNRIPFVEKMTTCQQGTGNEGKTAKVSQPGFSNVENSYKTSLGISQIRQSNPTNNWNIEDSLIVNGMENFNSNSARRHILVHKGTYSHGCFVLPNNSDGDYILNKLKAGGTIMSYYPSADYLQNSSLVGIGKSS